MGQDIFDVIIVLVLTAFAARGFWTGFVGEVAGLISIVGGFWVSHHFHTVLAPHLTFITEPAWRNIASYVLLFLGVLIAVGLLARLLQKLLAFSFVGWIDKLTGGLLGLAKGVLLCAVVLLLLQKLFGDAENGCPWDKEQTPESLTEYLIEESHELVSAIRSGNTADVCEELGDVAFLLLFVAHLYQKRGQFSLDDALNNNRAKMVRRHPHVFGDVTFDNLDEQLKTWEKIKRAEHTDAEGKPQGLFDSLPSSLPPLTKAYRIHSKAARVGFTWPEDEEVEQQVEAEWLEWLDASAGDDAEAQKHELGDLIFSITEMGRRKGIKASEALDLATARFLRRFARMEELARQQGKDFPDLSLDEKDELWNAAKEEEKAAH